MTGARLTRPRPVPLRLQIFAQRARTREAKLQVTLARMRYMLPRLKSFMTTGAGMDAKGGAAGGGKGAQRALPLEGRQWDASPTCPRHVPQARAASSSRGAASRSSRATGGSTASKSRASRRSSSRRFLRRFLDAS